jgi:tetratricopeptide (TPR) repeat protein
MRFKIVWLTAGVAVACLGGVGLYRLHETRLEQALLESKARPPQPAGDRPPVTVLEWKLRHDAVRTKLAEDVTSIVGLLKGNDGDASRTSAAVSLVNLPGDAVQLVAAQVARTDLDEGPKAVLTRALPALKARAMREERRRAAREAFLAHSLSAYDQYGTHDPKWDAAARDAMTLYLRCPSEQSRTPEEEQDISRLFDWVVHKVKCTDPLMQYECACAEAEFQLPEARDAASDFGGASSQVATSRYPADWRTVITAGPLAPEVDGRYRAAVQIRQLSAAFDNLAAATLLTPAERGLAAFTMIEQARFLRLNPLASRGFPDRRVDFDRVYPVVARELAGTPEPLLLKGKFYMQWAWDIRGGAFASEVGEENLAVFRERLGIAREALSQAYELDRSDPRAAVAMVRACRGLTADRAEMEKWFNRAMAADPDAYEACVQKLEYLQPFWYGNGRTDELLKFARECRDSGNYRGRIPLVLAEAHLGLARHTADAPAYLGHPVIWADIRGVYEAQLGRFPDDRYDRTRYAMLAAWAGKTDDANRQFRLLGENPWPHANLGQGLSYDELKERITNPQPSAVVP